MQGVTKEVLIKKIWDKNTSLTKKDITAVVNTLFSEMEIALSERKSVIVRGIGSIHPVKRASKKARDIRKGESVIIPERYTLKIKVSDSLKYAMNK